MAKIDISPYKKSHSRPAPQDRFGCWILKHEATGEILEVMGRLRDIKRTLPRGTWMVMP